MIADTWRSCRSRTSRWLPGQWRSRDRVAGSWRGVGTCVPVPRALASPAWSQGRTSWGSRYPSTPARCRASTCSSTRGISGRWLRFKRTGLATTSFHGTKGPTSRRETPGRTTTLRRPHGGVTTGFGAVEIAPRHGDPNEVCQRWITGLGAGCSIDPARPNTLQLAGGQTMRFITPEPGGPYWGGGCGPVGGPWRSQEVRVEVFAEEAGRAAAVSLPHLRRPDGFRDFLDLANRGARLPTGGLADALPGSGGDRRQHLGAGHAVGGRGPADRGPIGRSARPPSAGRSREPDPDGGVPMTATSADAAPILPTCGPSPNKAIARLPTAACTRWC